MLVTKLRCFLHSEFFKIGKLFISKVPMNWPFINWLIYYILSTGNRVYCQVWTYELLSMLCKLFGYLNDIGTKIPRPLIV